MIALQSDSLKGSLIVRVKNILISEILKACQEEIYRILFFYKEIEL